MSTVNNEGNLIFDSVEANGQKAYVAEFKATGPFSLHIERRESGRITVYQKSYENGKYATVKNVDIAPQDTIIDAEVPGGVFPKWIKIKSSSGVEVAEVTFEDAQSGGGAGTESTMEYLDVSGVGPLGIFLCSLYSYQNKFPVQDTVSISSGIRDANTGFIACSICFSDTIVIAGRKTTILEDLISSGITEEQLAAIPRITKEQFYNLEA